ncbi:MAG TPA: type II secretion system protein GspL [Pseudoxanthomonas sp.]|nr:type II secretion system protein GspL [Pseudoxanthomonas sp.]
MTSPPTTTLLVLLPTDPMRPARCLRIDSGGDVLERLDADTARPLPAAFTAGIARTVLAVPGAEVRTLWMDLPAHSPAQAQAAARVLLAERVAGPREGLHIAIGPRPSSGPTLVAVVQATLLRHWLDRARALGVVADVAVPQPLLLPPPDTDDELVAAIYGDQWLVRADRLAFAAEPGLARQVLGTRAATPVTGTEAVERLLAREAAGGIALDLLQYEFALAPETRARGPDRRRLAALAAAVVLSPLLVTGVQALRYELAARSLQRQSTALAAPLVSARTAEPIAALRRERDLLQAPAIFRKQRQALLSAIAAEPGLHLESLEYSAEAGLSAKVVHPTDEQLQRLVDSIRRHGLEVRVSPSAATGQGSLASVIDIGAGA